MALLTFERTIGSARVFELHGALDNAQVEKLSGRVAHVLDEGATLLIFDLGKLTFVTSSGLAVFLTAYRRLQGKGHVRFAALQPDVRRVFDVTALTARVELYPTVEEAVVGPKP